MAISSRQIGWSTTSNLLWQISKQLERLICVSGGCTTSTTTSTSSTTTTTTTIIVGPYTFQFRQCCSDEAITLYSSSPSIIVGTVLYTDIELTETYNGDFYVLLLDANFCPGSYDTGILVNLAGEVYSMDVGGKCE
jgi:hypothetical protein